MENKMILSDREKEIVRLVAKGFRDSQIAEQLFIGEPTVHNHLLDIFEKLGVSDQLELALYVIHGGIIISESNRRQS